MKSGCKHYKCVLLSGLRGVEQKEIISILRQEHNDALLAMLGNIWSVCLDCRHTGRYSNHIRFHSTYKGGPVSIWQYQDFCSFFLSTRSCYSLDLCHLRGPCSVNPALEANWGIAILLIFAHQKNNLSSPEKKKILILIWNNWKTLKRKIKWLIKVQLRVFVEQHEQSGGSLWLMMDW